MKAHACRVYTEGIHAQNAAQSLPQVCVQPWEDGNHARFSRKAREGVRMPGEGAEGIAHSVEIIGRLLPGITAQQE